MEIKMQRNETKMKITIRYLFMTTVVTKIKQTNNGMSFLTLKHFS
jgi:hypothetical protein